MKVEKTIKVTLEDDEIKALKLLSNVKCNGIGCEDCPYVFRFRDGKDHCLSHTATKVLLKVGGENESSETY